MAAQMVAARERLDGSGQHSQRLWGKGYVFLVDQMWHEKSISEVLLDPLPTHSHL